MSAKKTPQPKIASRQQWLAQRKQLLREEKRATKHHDRVTAARRRLPMVRLEKEYEFETHQGRKSPARPLRGRRQLIVYHFMFDPKWDKGCPGCTGYVNSLGDLSMLAERDTTFALISRGAAGQTPRVPAENGLAAANLGFLSQQRFQLRLPRHPRPAGRVRECNFKPSDHTGESHGLSVFLPGGKEIFHTYSAYARGVESVNDSYSLLDCTPFGRQEDWEDSPRGWPQKPTYG